MLAQGWQLDCGEGLHVEVVGQGQLVELGRDGLGSQRIDIAPRGKVDIRVGLVGSFGSRTEELHLGDLGMTAKDGANSFQLGRGHRRGVHGETRWANHSCMLDNAGRYCCAMASTASTNTCSS